MGWLWPVTKPGLSRQAEFGLCRGSSSTSARARRREGPRVCRLAAGGNRIRTLGPTRDNLHERDYRPSSVRAATKHPRHAISNIAHILPEDFLNEIWDGFCGRLRLAAAFQVRLDPMGRP